MKNILIFQTTQYNDPSVIAPNADFCELANITNILRKNKIDYDVTFESVINEKHQINDPLHIKIPCRGTEIKVFIAEEVEKDVTRLLSHRMVEK